MCTKHTRADNESLGLYLSTSGEFGKFIFIVSGSTPTFPGGQWNVLISIYGH